MRAVPAVKEFTSIHLLRFLKSPLEDQGGSLISSASPGGRAVTALPGRVSRVPLLHMLLQQGTGDGLWETSRERAPGPEAGAFVLVGAARLPGGAAGLGDRHPLPTASLPGGKWEVTLGVCCVTCVFCVRLNFLA